MDDASSITSSSDHNKGSSSSSGRKGDPRMHKAVAARMENPKLSPFEALQRGGFEYTKDLAEALDPEGIALSQRKNQLSRRLRQSGKKRNLDVLAGDPSLALDTSSDGARLKTETSSRPTTLLRAKNHPHFAANTGPKASTVALANNNSPASAAALTLLNQTAHTVGLSLTELAERLAQNPHVLLSPQQDPAATAVTLYQAQAPLLRSRALVAAGYSHDVAHDRTSEPYRTLMETCWQAEGQDLGHYQQAPQQPAATMEASHTHEHSHTHQNDSPSAAASCVYDRHIHRLEGKCGHQAVLHQPSDGTAPHIDFVVGDTVECYQSISTMKHADDIRVWPSRFTCEDLSCKDTCASNNNNTDNKTQKNGHEKNHNGDCIPLDPPKIFNLEDLNTSGDEWNFDFLNDSSLLGLVKLSGGGGPHSASASTSSEA